MPYITAVLHPEITFMDRRKSLKILGGTAVGIAGLVLADWKWQLVDQLTHNGFFSFMAISDALLTSVCQVNSCALMVVVLKIKNAINSNFFIYNFILNL